jgi:hypothetical protein
LSSELDLNGVPPSKIVQIHEAKCEALNMSVGEMENENVTLKERIKELESALMPHPYLLAQLLQCIHGRV